MLCIPVYKYVYIFIIHSFLNVYKQIYRPMVSNASLWSQRIPTPAHSLWYKSTIYFSSELVVPIKQKRVPALKTCENLVPALKTCIQKADYAGNAETRYTYRYSVWCVLSRIAARHSSWGVVRSECSAGLSNPVPWSCFPPHPHQCADIHRRAAIREWLCVGYHDSFSPLRGLVDMLPFAFVLPFAFCAAVCLCAGYCANSQGCSTGLMQTSELLPSFLI